MSNLSVGYKTPLHSDKFSDAKSGFKWLVLALAILVLLLGAFAFYVVAVARAERNEILRRIEGFAAAGLPVDDNATAQRFLELTDQEYVVAWSEILGLVDFAMMKDRSRQLPNMKNLESAFSFDETDLDSKKTAGLFLDDMRPLIFRIRQLTDRDEPTWQPIVFRGHETWLSPIQSACSLTNLAMMDCAYSVDQGELDRAVEALKSHRVSISAFDFQIGVTADSIYQNRNNAHHYQVLSALADKRWTGTQMAEISSTIAPREDFATRWRNVWQFEFGMFVRQMTHGGSEVPSYVRIEGLPEAHSPNFRRTSQVLDLFPLIQSVGVGSFEGLISRWTKLKLQASRLEPPSKFEQLSSFFRSHPETSFYLGYITDYVSQCVSAESLRCFTKLAVAIKQHQLAHAEWPQSLDQLVDIDPECLQSLTNENLQYVVNPDGKSVELIGVTKTVIR